jgi:hypothetical protein
VLVRGADQVVLDLQILEKELNRLIVIRLDPAHFCRRHDDNPGPFLGKEFLDSLAIHQVKLSPGAGHQSGKSLGTQLAQDGAADETTMASYEDRFVLFHQVLDSIRLAFPFSSRCAILP